MPEPRDSVDPAAENTANSSGSHLSPPPAWLKYRGLLVPSVVLAAAIAGLVVIARRPVTPRPPRLPPALFEKACKPCLNECGEANRQAAERAVGRIKELIAQCRRGISPFTDDITSIGTRLRILKRMPGQWWYSDGRVQDYVRCKFEQHLFSEEKLKTEISGFLLAYREEVQANQNKLLGAVRASIERENMPGVAVPDFGGYADTVKQEIVQFSGKGATGTIHNGIASLVLCEVASVAAEQLVVRVLATFGTTAATSAAASGGATAGGAAAGGGTGSLAGPVGTAIGVGVGLVIGVIVDWWMTERFRGRLAEDLNAYFDKLEFSLLEGEGASGGFGKALMAISARLTSAQEDAMRHTLLEVAK